MKDFRVNIRVTNANIQRSIEGMGYASIPKWCEDFGYNYSTLNGYIALKISPLDKYGNIKQSAEQLCNLLGESFDSIFSEHQRDALKTNRASVDVSFDEIVPMLTSDGSELLDVVYAKEKNAALHKGLGTLTPRERDVLLLRNNIDTGEEKTLEAVADTLGVSRERVRQLEQTALRKMRHPDRADYLRPFLDGERTATSGSFRELVA
jgi:RNA polymerase sigma factor (sigma-70 family)